MELHSPAKVNFFFRILKKRADGFHEIASLYQAISLCDTLRIEKSNEDRLICDHPEIPLDETNLILRAAELFREKTKISQHFTFTLDKRIPIQAGLGAGSSNAATALWGMNQLTGQQVEINSLAKWGAELGSDVPFFFSGGTAYCEGRGEKITSIPPISSSTKLWIAKPKMGLSTPRVYQQVDVSLLPKREPKQVLQSHFLANPEYFNDLEQAAFTLLPQLETLKKELLQLGFSHVIMSGSGTAFICLGRVKDPHLSGVNFYSVQCMNFNNKDNALWY